MKLLNIYFTISCMHRKSFKMDACKNCSVLELNCHVSGTEIVSMFAQNIEISFDEYLEVKYNEL